MGTGKTYTLKRWVEAAVEKYGPLGVMVSSFTRAAATELVSRGVPVARENIGTLHSLCHRALGRPTVAEGKIAEWNAEHPTMMLSGAKHDLDDPYAQDASGTGSTKYGDKTMQTAQRLRQMLTPRSAWPENALYFQTSWEEWLAKTGYVDFTGMLEHALEQCPIAPNAPAVGFFDEAQDFSALELRLVRSWMAEMDFGVLVHDPDQTLYAFKGADPRTLLDSDVVETKVLSQSYRVPRAVHALASDWIGRCSFRFPSEYLPRDEDGEVAHSGATFNYPNALVADILERIGDSETAMVLASCGYMLNPLIKQLRREGIPFWNPYRTKHGGWNPMRGARRLMSFMRPDPRLSVKDAPNRLWTWEELHAWTGMVKAKGTLKAGAKKRIAAEHKARTSDAEIAQQVTPSELVELLEPDALKDLQLAFEGGSAPEWLGKRMLPDAWRKAQYALDVEARRGPLALREDPRLIIGTAHSVKGGESDHVYLFPDLSPAANAEWLGSEEQQDSVRRTFYVGMTRARKTLTLMRPSGPAVRWTQ